MWIHTDIDSSCSQNGFWKMIFFVVHIINRQCLCQLIACAISPTTCKGASNSRDACFGITYRLRSTRTWSKSIIHVGGNIGVIFLSRLRNSTKNRELEEGITRDGRQLGARFGVDRDSDSGIRQRADACWQCRRGWRHLRIQCRGRSSLLRPWHCNFATNRLLRSSSPSKLQTLTYIVWIPNFLDTWTRYLELHNVFANVSIGNLKTQFIRRVKQMKPWV